jgi:hypothetical protein
VDSPITSGNDSIAPVTRLWHLILSLVIWPEIIYGFYKELLFWVPFGDFRLDARGKKDYQ